MKHNSLSFLSILALGLLSAAPRHASAAPGDFYVSEFNAGQIIKITPTGVRTTFATGVGNVFALSFDPSGNLFAEDGIAGQLFKVAPNGGTSVFATNLYSGSVVADSSGNIFFATGSGDIVKLSPSGTKTTFATGAGGEVSDLAFDQLGNLFSSDFKSGAIYKFAPDGTRTTPVTGFEDPTALAFGRLGYLYVADSFLRAIYRVAPNGSKTVVASNTAQIRDMVVDDNESIFAIPFPNTTVVKYSPQGAMSTMFTGFSSLRAITIEPPTGRPLNVSSRVDVQTGDNAAIAGMIIKGTGQKKVIIRGIGPSLAAAGVTGALEDPTLEVFRSDGVRLALDDNWRLADQAAKQATGLAPTDDRESAIIVNVSAPTTLTAVLRGKNNTTGVGLVEVYDLDPAGTASLANLSTRGLVGLGPNVLIGGFIIGGGSNGTGRVVVRAIGPSLTAAGVAGALSDPTLTLRDANGVQIDTNDNWRHLQQLEIESTGLAPTSAFESAIVATLPQGNYTAIVEGKQGATGVGLVEIYYVP